MDKKPSPQAEALANQLKAKLTKERPRWHRWVPLATLGVLCGLAFLAWWLYPVAVTPRLTATAFDSLATTDGPYDVAAILEPQDADAKPGRLRDLEMVFWEEKSDGLDASPRLKAICNDYGMATATLETVGPRGTPFYARDLSTEKKYETKDRAHAFAFPRNSSILLVEVEDTLADLDPGEWSNTNPINIAVRPGAAAALRSVGGPDGWRVVYLALNGARPKDYRRVRGWVENKGAEADALPRGPVLGPWSVGGRGEQLVDARKVILQHVKAKFDGKIAAVVRTSHSAEICQEYGIRAIATGGGDFPPEIARIKSWAELPAALGK